MALGAIFTSACIPFVCLHYGMRETTRLEKELENTKKEIFKVIFEVDSCTMNEIDTETLIYIVNIINKPLEEK